jgi:hypothetical protein
VRPSAGGLGNLGEGSPVPHRHLSMQQWYQNSQQSRHAAGIIEVVQRELARGPHTEHPWRLSADPLQTVEAE